MDGFFLLQGNGKMENEVMSDFLKEARIEAQVEVYIPMLYIIIYLVIITGYSSG